MLPGSVKQFTLGQNVPVDWSAPDGGTVVDGLFTAPNTNGSFRVVATSIVDPLAQATAIVNVSNVAISVTPASIAVAPGSVTPNAFVAVVAGSADRTVTWSLDQNVAGSVASGANDASGNATATFTAGTTPGIYAVRATSHADNTVSDVGEVQILGRSALGLSPQAVTLSATPPNNAVTLSAILTDSAGHVDTTTTLTWDVPANPVNGTLSGSDPRQRTFTVPPGFVGVATCQVRVRTPQGNAVFATIQVVSG